MQAVDCRQRPRPQRQRSSESARQSALPEFTAFTKSAQQSIIITASADLAVGSAYNAANGISAATRPNTTASSPNDAAATANCTK